MLIRTENFEIECGLFYLAALRWYSLDVGVGHHWWGLSIGRFEVFLERDAVRWPMGWFAKNDPGEPWERWGFGFHLICQIRKPWKAPAG